MAGIVAGTGVMPSWGGEIANTYVSVQADEACLTRNGDLHFIAYCPPGIPPSVTFTVEARKGYELVAPDPNLEPKRKGTMNVQNTGEGGWGVKPENDPEPPPVSGGIFVKNVTLEPISVSFGNCIHGWVTSDKPEGTPPAYTAYDPPHWTRDIEKTKPIAIVSTQKPTVAATFQVMPPSIPKDTGGIKVRAKGMKATKGANGVEYEEVIFIKPTAVTLRPAKVNPAGEVTVMEADLAVTSFDKPIADVIKHYPDGSFTLNWEMSTGGNQNADSSWYPIGQTPHTVYVTLKDPKTTLRQESLFYISCQAADTEDKMNNVPERVWTGFEGRNVCRVDGEQLTYYKKYGNGIRTTADLLAGGDGECDAWTYLFLDALKIQGFEFKKNNFCRIRPLRSDANPQVGSGMDTGFMISTWQFGEPNVKHTSAPHRYKNTPVRVSWFNASRTDYEWEFPAVVNYTAGTPGQGNGKPQALFPVHYMAYVIVTVNGRTKEMFYDPSYGKKFDPNDPTIQPVNKRPLAQQFMSVVAGYYKSNSDFDVRFRKPTANCEIKYKVDIKY